MSNMSYCRFHNTNSAMKDCLEAVWEALDAGFTMQQFKDSLSADESYAFTQLFMMVEDMVACKEQFEYNETA